MVVNETREPKPKTGNVNLEPLTVNAETLQDLSDETQQKIAGGAPPRSRLSCAPTCEVARADANVKANSRPPC